MRLTDAQLRFIASSSAWFCIDMKPAKPDHSFISAVWAPYMAAELLGLREAMKKSLTPSVAGVGSGHQRSTTP